MNYIYPFLDNFMKPASKNHNLYIICKLKIYNQTKIGCYLSILISSCEIRLTISVIFASSILSYLRGFLTDLIVGRCLAFNYSGRS